MLNLPGGNFSLSLLKLMYGDEQLSTLADAIRAALMLRYNDRVVG